MRHRTALLLAILTALTGCAKLRDLQPASLPAAQPVSQVVQPEQNWSAEQRDWFHHTSQGTATLPIPYPWFLALEQPTFTPWKAPRFADPQYLSRYGFLPSPKGSYNPDALPIGFARDREFVDPVDGKKTDAIGFTCAACHTGQVNFQGKGIRIEGGPAFTNLGKFRRNLGLALFYTRRMPFRFGRFADAVLGPQHSAEQAAGLKQQLDTAIAKGLSRKAVEEAVDPEPLEEGFGRLDALGRIANLLFGHELNPANVAPLIAPVNYPHLWDTSWFDWVQYNGSIQQPMERNAGEALGVGALVNLRSTDGSRFKSTVQVQNLADMEAQLAGNAPFQGLRPPRWPADILGPIDPVKSAKGAELYATYCQSCHRPPMDSAEMQAGNSDYWIGDDGSGRRYLKLAMLKTDYIGTDPAEARTMLERTIDAGPLGGGKVPYGKALTEAVDGAVTRWYDEHGIAADERERMNGNRKSEVQAKLQYRARPLDGIWATPPYLHNGSVPNLYMMLVPASERPSVVYLGNREYDPTCVGYVNAPIDNGFALDTTLPGNRNTGHEFSGEAQHPTGNGVIGPRLNEEQRWAIVEYLKTL